jgi:cobalt-zinc-cadmium efflux system membrane fusion protein
MRYLAIFVIVLAGAGCSRQKAAAPVKAAPAKSPAGGESSVMLDAAAQKEAGVAIEEARRRSLPQVLRANARLTNDENLTWRVGAITEGRIAKVLANPGDFVKTGQVIARMHSHDIHESRAEYRKAVNELARLKNVAEYSRRVRERARRLYELKAGSQEQWELSETELRNAETAVGNAQFEVERTRTHLVEFLGIPAEYHGPQRPGARRQQRLHPREGAGDGRRAHAEHHAGHRSDAFARSVHRERPFAAVGHRGSE